MLCVSTDSITRLKGMMKHLVECEDAGQATLDHAFIAEHSVGFEALAADLRAESWALLVRESGLSEAQIRAAAEVYRQAERAIVCWGMGITQHVDSVATIQMLVNLLMLRGNIGRPGAGACPVRGHSNVQGDRTMGIWEKPPAALLDRAARRSSASSRRASPAATRWSRSARCATAAARSSSRSAATSPPPRPTPTRPGRRCAAATSRCTSRPSSTAATWCTGARR